MSKLVLENIARKYENVRKGVDSVMGGAIVQSRKLPIGIQSFRSLREGGYVYADKTALIYRLVHSGKQFFLSRPRRFGKSLLLSTLRAYWEGKKPLFEGLAINELESENTEAWKQYPVFYFDLNRGSFLEKNSLELILDAHLAEWEKQYGCEELHTTSAIRFQNILKRAFQQTGLHCVVLVDEYDKPLLETMDNPDLQAYNKAVFKGFFSTLKSFDDYIQFVFITGVTKFSKVSVFSDLNQLKDISLNNKFAGICGITELEMVQNFTPEISCMAKSCGYSFDECVSELRKTYDGYHFHPNGPAVYNPFSLLNALYDQDFRYYWFETGTPSFLVRKIKSLQFDIRKFSDQSLYADEQTLLDYRGDNPDPIPLLYQTGYLTIIGYEQLSREYVLGFPNEEVKFGFLNSLLPEYVENYGPGSGKDISTLRRFAERGDLDGIREVFTALFASIPYTDSRVGFEHDFQTVIYLVFTLLGQFVHCEVFSAHGRADCIVETGQFIYIFEFKRDGTAEEALRQIEEKGYSRPYASDPRKCYKIGVTFDSVQRTLSDWTAVE